MPNHWLKPLMGQKFQSNIDFSNYQGAGSCSHLPNLRQLFHSVNRKVSLNSEEFTYKIAPDYERTLANKVRREILVSTDLANFLVDKNVISHYETRQYVPFLHDAWRYEVYIKGNLTQFCNWVVGSCNFYDLERERINGKN